MSRQAVPVQEFIAGIQRKLTEAQTSIYSIADVCRNADAQIEQLQQTSDQLTRENIELRAKVKTLEDAAAANAATAAAAAAAVPPALAAGKPKK